MKKDSIRNRMKDNYEDRQRFYLIRRTPVILHLDGKAFHTFTKELEEPTIEKQEEMLNEYYKQECLRDLGTQGGF
jgi:tRNA(His) 5'-end guanylyltransferase